jgi:gas vesicle protein
MNDTTNSRDNSPIGSTLVGFALGAMVGAGLALLLAPESGKKTRDRLASTARRWSKDAGHALEGARDTVAELGADAKSAMKAGKDAFVQDRVAREARSERWMSHSAESAPGLNSQERAAEESAR